MWRVAGTRPVLLRTQCTRGGREIGQTFAYVHVTSPRFCFAASTTPPGVFGTRRTWSHLAAGRRHESVTFLPLPGPTSLSAAFVLAAHGVHIHTEQQWCCISSPPLHLERCSPREKGEKVGPHATVCGLSDPTFCVRLRFVTCKNVCDYAFLYLVETGEERVDEVHDVVRIAARRELLEAGDIAEEDSYLGTLLQDIFYRASILQLLRHLRRKH